MKQVFKSNIGIITREVPIPVSGDKEILVKVYNSVISTGTETASMRKEKNMTISDKLLENKSNLKKLINKIRENGINETIKAVNKRINPSEEIINLVQMGYSNSGIVLDKGKLVENFNIGDRVACAGYGIAAHAEYVTVPINLAVKISNSVSYEDAAFATIGSIAMQGLRRANVTPGEKVVIIGLGLLGLLAVQIAKSWGLVVIGTDLKKQRIILAKELGADICFNISDKDIEEKIMQYTSNIGADAVIIYAATTSSKPANQAMRICRRRGRVVVVGEVGMDLERTAMYKKELDFVMSTSYGPGRYDGNYEIKGNDYPIGFVRWTENRNMQEFIRLIKDKKIKTKSLVSNTFNIDNAKKAYDYLVNGSSSAISVLFSYNMQSDNNSITHKLVLNFNPITKNKINVGVIGAGGFVSRTHLPNLLKLNKYYNLIATSNKTPSKAKMIGKKFKPKYITTDYLDILNDKDIDMVIIGTRHNLHAQMVIEALKVGKHILVEKPLAMNLSELKKIKKESEKSNSFLTVGFNRRYSPLSIRAKEVIDKKGYPIFINYRVNAGYVSNYVWVQDLSVGGGRIVGEICHFLDLFNYFVDAEIRDIKVSSIPIDGKLINANDNVSVTVSYKNGSVAHLSYVSIGNEELNKERIEIFCGKSCMVIDDFNSLEMYGTGEKNIKFKNKDKGWLNELKEFAKLIKGEDSLIISVDEVFLATEETFEIEKQING